MTLDKRDKTTATIALSLIPSSEQIADARISIARAQGEQKGRGGVVVREAKTRAELAAMYPEAAAELLRRRGKLPKIRSHNSRAGARVR